MLLVIAAMANAQDKAGHSGINSQGGAGSASGQERGSASQLSKAEQKFIKNAAKGGMMEVEMGRLGVQKAQNPAVKQYAQRLMDEHTKANAALKQLAASKGITLPDQPIVSSQTSKGSERIRVRGQPEEAPEQQRYAGFKRLLRLSGSDFDREFVRMALNDHEKDVKDFEKQAQKAKDPDVKAFAQKTAPTLREHLQHARSLETQMGAPGTKEAPQRH